LNRCEDEKNKARAKLRKRNEILTAVHAIPGSSTVLKALLANYIISIILAV